MQLFRSSKVSSFAMLACLLRPCRVESPKSPSPRSAVADETMPLDLQPLVHLRFKRSVAFVHVDDRRTEGLNPTSCS